MNPGGKAPSCVPTWRGHVETTKDALLIFEACFNGTLSHCFRRPHDRERNALVASGNVFVYEEATSGIKRWTDGIPWSPSRILTNFLIYRQLNTPFPPGEKKRATKRNERSARHSESNASSTSNTSPVMEENKAIFGPPPGQAPAQQSGHALSHVPAHTPGPGSGHAPIPAPDSPEASSHRDHSPDISTNRGLVGSLVDSYEFKKDGLLKKTMTVTVNNVQHHLVSYYSLDDAKYRLKTPRDDARLKDLQVREALLHQPKFKFPNLDDPGDGTYDQPDATTNPYGSYYHNGYDPSRMYAPHHMGYMQGSPAYAYHPTYAHPHYQTAAASYAHAPSAQAAYHSMHPSSHYPQHQPQYSYHPSHGMPHYAGHAQHAPSYAGHYYHSQPAPTPPRPQETKSEPVSSRSNGVYDYESSAHIETGNDVYGPSSMTGPPVSESTTSMSQAPQSQSQSHPHSHSHSQAQPWPMAYSHHPYPSYRQ